MKKTSSSSATAANRSKTSKTAAKGRKSTRSRSAKSQASAANETIPLRAGTTKIEQCLTMLNTAEGVTIDQLMAATGWQAHSVRGFLAGTVKRKLALTLDSKRPDDGARRYRVVRPGA